MSEQWPIVTLGEICTFRNGGTPKKSIPEYWTGDIPFITGADIDVENGTVKPPRGFITEEAISTSSTQIIPTTSILLVTRTGVGKVAIPPFPVCVSQDFTAISFDNDEVDQKFMYYVIKSAKKSFLSQTRGATIQGITREIVSKHEFMLPPFNEQQRIVSILDEAFSKIRFAQDNLSNNREEAVDLIKSCVDETFSGAIDSEDSASPIVKLGELCDVITKGTTPTSLGYQFVESGINFIKIESITTNGEFLEHKFAKITSECHEGLKRSQLRDRDILFSIAGALGRTAYVTESILPANTNQALAIIRLKKSDSVHPQYILKALSTGFALNQIEKNRAGAAQQNLSLTQMKAFEIPLPPIEVQKQISSKIDIILSNAISLQNSIEAKATGYIELQQSILQEAFNGKLSGGTSA